MQRGVANPHQTYQRTFAVDPFDYRPVRVGLKQRCKAIVIEYFLKSNGKRFLHNIKVGKYTDSMAFGVSVSRSGSFQEALGKEVSNIVDRIYGDHCEYLPPEKIERHQVENLVQQILIYNQSKKREKHQTWHEVKSTSIGRRSSDGRKDSKHKYSQQTKSTLSQSRDGSGHKQNSMSPAGRQVQAASPPMTVENQMQSSFFGKRGSS